VAVHLGRQLRDALAQGVGEFGEPRVLIQKPHELFRLLGGKRLPLFACLGERFTVLGVGVGVGLVAVRLPRLRQAGSAERRRRLAS